MKFLKKIKAHIQADWFTLTNMFSKECHSKIILTLTNGDIIIGIGDMYWDEKSEMTCYLYKTYYPIRSDETVVYKGKIK